MTAAIVDLLFEQGIPRDVVVADWKDDDGNAYDLSGFSAQMMIRSSVADAMPLFTKTSAPGGGITILQVSGVWTVDAAFTDQETASMNPPTIAIRPVGAFGDSAPTYRLGLWELRLTSAGGIEYSVTRGTVYVTLGVVR